METGRNSTVEEIFFYRKKEVTFMMNFPKDPVMLLSYVNTQLRDHYASMEELCKSCAVSMEEIDAKLASIDYRYDPETNRYV